MNHVHLNGSEDVAKGGMYMLEAAAEMKRAASSIEQSVINLQQVLSDFSREITDIMKPPTQKLELPIPKGEWIKCSDSLPPLRQVVWIKHITAIKHPIKRGYRTERGAKPYIWLLVSHPHDPLKPEAVSEWQNIED